MKLLPQNEFEYYLTYEGLRTKLIFAPEGWDKDTIGELSRDTYYKGLLRTLSLPLNFVLDGKSIIQAAFLKYSFEAQVILEVKQLERSSMVYRPLYNSELDFSQYDNDGTTVSVILMEGGVSKLIKAAESTKFEYALTGPDIVNVILPGVVFAEDAQSIFTQEGASDRFMPAIDLVINNTNSEFVTVQNVEQEENITDDSVFSTSPNWFLRGNRPLGQVVTIKIRLKGAGYKAGLGSGNDFKILLKDSNNTTVRTIFESPSMNTGDIVNFDFEREYELTAAQNQRFFIYVRTDTIPSILKVAIGEGDLIVNYSSKSDPSNCKGIRAEDLYKRIIARLAPGTTASFGYNFRASWANLVITSGNAIRELTDAVIQTSFRDYFDTFNGIDSAGFGLDNSIAVIETLPYFYRNSRIVPNALTAKSCSMTVAIEYVGNRVLIGYEDGNTDDKDGQFEYNSGQEYQNGITRIKNDLDWRSKYQAAQYKIEKLRVDFVKKTNDTSSDNEVYMLDCYFDGTNYRPILGSSYRSVAGMPNNDAGQGSYNLRLTPKNNLLRHGTYLRSIHDKLDNRYIEFASAEKNKDLVTIDSNGKRVAEKDSVLVGSLADKFFKPIIATVVLKLPPNMMQLMDATPFGYIPFIWQGQEYKGYVLDLGIDLARNTERECKLLLTPENYI